MVGNKRRDTSPEMAVRRMLHRRGLRYRVDLVLPFDRRRRADITFPTEQLVVFIDGCFWHGCPEHYVPPKSHADYWASKVEGNRRRDAETTATMVALGWSVTRVWEHQSPEDIADLVEAQVLEARTASARAVSIRRTPVVGC